MMRRCYLVVLCSLFGMALMTLPASAGDLTASAYKPDPYAVQRYGPAYRYPQAGWIVLHIEGKPYERGYQHGQLMSPEIAAAVRCAAALTSPKAPTEGWRVMRMLVNSLFVRHYEPEYLEEMKGIAAGAAAAGSRFDNRPIDLVDIVALNCWPEIDSLSAALDATPTGLEGKAFPKVQPGAKLAVKPMHCSAFAATGPATRDGKIVFGHITMFALYPSLFYNVWLDVKPEHGHRVLMQSYPGGIQSGMDYYMNDAGLVVCETTLTQTHFDITGQSVASRIREALQYADNIDQAVEILKKSNNGLYTNEWLLGDTKTNEIAMFELGTAKSKLYRSSRDEWFGGTRGFYWGCNNTKDIDVRLETIPSVKDRPGNMVWTPSPRDKKWVELYRKYNGHIDADFGKTAFTTPPLAAFHSLDAKFTTSDMAKDLKTYALFGPPLGRSWEPSDMEKQSFPEIRPLCSHPWTILDADPPPVVDLAGVTAHDIPGRPRTPEQLANFRQERMPMQTVPAWHGTLLPRTDADEWLASGSAEYERIVAAQIALKERVRRGAAVVTGRDQLAVALFGPRSTYLAAAHASGDTALSNIQNDIATDVPQHIAGGKGVLLLHALHEKMGDTDFIKMMDVFGRQHAGKEVSTQDFIAHVEKWSGKPQKAFFDAWLNHPGLPKLHLVEAVVKQGKVGHDVQVAVKGDTGWPTQTVDVTVETPKSEITKKITVGPGVSRVVFHMAEEPLRVIVDKYAHAARGNGGAFSIRSFYGDFEHALIVYGTHDEAPMNREAAEKLQKAIITSWSNYTVPIKADAQVTEADLKSHHLLLIGRPDSNALVARWQARLPVKFGWRSFTVRRRVYAHPDSAVMVAAENPLNSKYSMVVIAGLSPESTLSAAPTLPHREMRAAEVEVLGHNDRPQKLVLPARDLTREFKQPVTTTVKAHHG